jgi:hypothetical protein
MGTLAHLEHFKTDSYSAHKALEKLYNHLPDAVDSFVEQWQGLNGRITSYPTWAPVPRSCARMCEDFVAWIDENADDLTADDISLENALAEIRTVVLRAMYRLNELK